MFRSKKVPGKWDHPSLVQSPPRTFHLIQGPHPSWGVPQVGVRLQCALVPCDSCSACDFSLLRMEAFFPRPSLTPTHGISPSVLSTAVAFWASLHYGLCQMNLIF